MFRELISELAVISVMATVAEILLPETGGNRPVYFVFGLYFIALLLNPLVAFWTETDLTALDFSSLAEERVIAVTEESVMPEVYAATAQELAAEIEAKLKALFPHSEFEARISMSENGFEQVIIEYDGAFNRDVEGEIINLLATDYGIGTEKILIQKEGSSE